MEDSNVWHQDSQMSMALVGVVAVVVVVKCYEKSYTTVTEQGAIGSNVIKNTSFNVAET